MISVKEAVDGAAKFLEEILAKEQILEPRLEEVELSDDGKLWYVTLSFIRTEPAPGVVEALRGRYERECKVFTVLTSDGKVLSMKMRQPV